MDAAYKSVYIAKKVFEDGRTAVLPYSRPKGKKKPGNRKSSFVYDSYYDQYICPNGEILHYTNTDKKGQRIYSCNPQTCKNCPQRELCTTSKTARITVRRHIWAKFLEMAEKVRKTDRGEALYKKRSETIERVFADAKEKHGMRYTQYRGLEKVSNSIALTFACMNLKKLAKWKEKNRKKVEGDTLFSRLKRFILRIRLFFSSKQRILFA